MILSINGKVIDTLPIARLLRQNETNADTITFQSPLFYESLDLSSLQFTLFAVPEYGEILSQPLTLSVAEPALDEDPSLSLLWTVTKEFTAQPGKLSLFITGQDENNTIVIKFTGAPIYIQPDPQINDNVPPSSQDLHNAMAQLQDILRQAQSIVTNTPYIGINGNWYVWDSEQKSYTDSGFSAQGSPGQQGPKGDTPTFDDTALKKDCDRLYSNAFVQAASGSSLSFSHCRPIPLQQCVLEGTLTIQPSSDSAISPDSPTEFIPLTNPVLSVSGLNCFQPSNVTNPSPWSIDLTIDAEQFQVVGKSNSTSVFAWAQFDFVPPSNQIVFGYQASADNPTNVRVLFQVSNDGTSYSTLYDWSSMANSIPLTLSTDKFYRIRFYGQNGTGDPSGVTYSNLFINPGTSQKYSPFVCEQYPVPYSLYSLADHVRDMFDLASGVLSRKVGVRTFRSSINWEFVDANNNTVVFQYPLADVLPGSVLLCNRFASSSDNTTDSISLSPDNALLLSISKSRFPDWSEDLSSSQKLALLNSWLSTHPVTLLYQLKNPALSQLDPIPVFPLPGFSKFSSSPSAPLQIACCQDSNLLFHDLNSRLSALESAK